ncbi:hypothetical protein [Tsukamurella sp. USMM236]|uniref:hypothetical protein n=1 Tax=Tsukamurella sp. USMM236 TaxID=3081301 RepID=UPI0030195481
MNWEYTTATYWEQLVDAWPEKITEEGSIGMFGRSFGGRLMPVRPRKFLQKPRVERDHWWTLETSTDIARTMHEITVAVDQWLLPRFVAYDDRDLLLDAMRNQVSRYPLRRWELAHELAADGPSVELESVLQSIRESDSRPAVHERLDRIHEWANSRDAK